jgi:hypothetical protein
MTHRLLECVQELDGLLFPCSIHISLHGLDGGKDGGERLLGCDAVGGHDGQQTRGRAATGGGRVRVVSDVESSHGRQSVGEAAGASVAGFGGCEVRLL